MVQTVTGNPSSITHTYDDGPNSYTISATATDEDGTFSANTRGVTVNNVAPTAIFNAPVSVNEGSLINLSISDPNDPSGTDITAGFQYAFDCGSGYGAWGSSNNASCPTTDNGSLTVKGKIRDKDGGEEEHTATVTVNDVLPTSVNAGGPYSSIVGQPVTITGSATCVTVDACTFAWDLDNDGLYDDAAGASIINTWNTLGTYTIGLQVTDNDGNAVTNSTTVNIAGITHSITLESGWNLVSFNVHPADTSIAAVLSSIAGNYNLVYAWDATGAHSGSGNWLKYDPGVPFGNSLTNLSETTGFWIHMTAADTLDVVGSIPVATNITLSTGAGGWNLVGYSSAGSSSLPAALSDHGVTDFTMVYAYHASDTTDPWKLFDKSAPSWVNDLTDMAPGWGYWVYVTSTSTWHVEY
jgi:hypothetical protein